jgi:hypothetical protein
MCCADKDGINFQFTCININLNAYNQIVLSKRTPRDGTDATSMCSRLTHSISYIP